MKFLNKALLALTLVISSASYANSYQPTDCCWSNSATLYGWIFGQKGCMTIGENTSDIDIRPRDVLSNLDLIDFLFQLHLESARDRWAFMFDPTVLAITSRATVTTPLPTPIPRTRRLNITTKIKFALIDMGAFYTAYMHCFCDSYHWIKFEVLAGFRDLYFDNCLTFEPVISFSNGANWFNGLFGFRFSANLYPGVNFILRGDASAGSRSHSFGANAIINWQFHPNGHVTAGFKTLDFCGSSSQGAGAFDMDIFYYGPVIGLGVDW